MLLDEGAALEATDSKGNTALHCAYLWVVGGRWRGRSRGGNVSSNANCVLLNMHPPAHLYSPADAAGYGRPALVRWWARGKQSRAKPAVLLPSLLTPRRDQ